MIKVTGMNPKSARRFVNSFALAISVSATVTAQPAVAQYELNRPGYGRPYPRDPDDGSRWTRRYRREAKREPASQSRNVNGAPLLAVVALGEQHITIYNAHGKMLQSPVSSGATGLETPAGIYSVVQKEEVHKSNVYQDGNMPFMQRITWTGIALHGGALPGYPASHGCVRMPEPFARRLFPLTENGMRVVVVRNDIAPAEISHPALFTPAKVRREALLVGPPTGPVASTDAGSNPSPAAAQLETLKSQVAAKSAEALAASKKAMAARQAAARKAAEAANADRNLRAAEAAMVKAEEALKNAMRAASVANSPQGLAMPGVRQAELAKEKAAAALASARAQLEADREKIELKDKAEARVAVAQTQLEVATEKAAAKLAETQALLEAGKQKAAARLSDTQAQLAAAKSQAQARSDDAAHAEADAKSAEAERELAADASADATHKLSPVSVFISRKTQRLYVRQNYIPVFEGPVMIRDPEKPIGSYVFTALGYGDNGEVRWSVVSMYKAGATGELQAGGQKSKVQRRSPKAAPADVAGAKAGLDRITIPQDVIQRFSEVVLPGASFIISDEGASIETGKDTDFVVLMSGEPQGGIKTRHVEKARYSRDYDDD